MSASASTASLDFPRPTPPAPGEMTEIAPGILWLRLALPFQLDHVNIYLLRDGDGWMVLDTGIADLRTRTAWQAVLDGRLRGEKLTRLVVTHFHPDHIGLAGWMTGELGLGLAMSQVEYLTAQNLRHNTQALGSATHRNFYLRHGLNAEATEAVIGRGHSYLKMTTGLPESYERLEAGETLRVGGRDFEILTGGGHAPEQVMLLCRSENIFLAADQVLARISPNIGVWPWEPRADPLGAYLRSLDALRAQVPDSVLALPAHNLPFYGLHQRIGELQHHHALRCDEIVAACANGARTTAEILPVLFHRPLDVHQTGFAFAEVLAHVNYLLRQRRLSMETGADGIIRVRRA
jgi:glyoxylase-like metal-dependent hydrolase (beta-lactamase superfamily II)